MSRYDGLIIPRSYSDYINKTDAATLSQALQLSGVMDDVPIAGSRKAVRSSGIEQVLNKFTYDNYDDQDPIDVISIIETMPLGKTSNLRIGGLTTNTPYGNEAINTDFFYTVYRLFAPNNYIRVIAYDVRENTAYIISKINGTWGNWIRIQNLEYFTKNNVITSGTLNCGESFVSYKNGTMKLSARFFNYDTHTVIQENDIIGVITQPYLRPSEIIKLPCYSFGNQHTYFIEIYPNGNITIGAVGDTSPVLYDIYINAVYVK